MLAAASVVFAANTQEPEQMSPQELKNPVSAMAAAECTSFQPFPAAGRAISARHLVQQHPIRRRAFGIGLDPG
jgi:hypothetical protein